MAEVATCPDVNDLQQLASGELPAAAVDALIGHVETCPSCLAKVQTLTPRNTLVDSLARASAPADGPDAEVVTRLIARLKALRAAPAADSVDDRTTEVRPASSPPASAADPDDPWAFLAPPQAADEIGRLGAYRILAVVGRGGMGVVFRAEDPGLKRVVAVKAMLPAFAASPSGKDRFLREAQTAASIQHDHIVTIHQVGEDRGVPFLAMEFLHGEPLDARLERTGRVPVADVLRIGREVADGLAAAHGRGLIHRDIKPANVWLEARPGRAQARVKLLDFGLARTAADQTGLTQTGAIIGTPAYMSPEQARGKPVDGRSDLWSLGVMLYEMTTGRRPFGGGDTLAVLSSLALDDPPPPDALHADIPKGLSDLIVRLLAKTAGGRPAGAQAVADELLRVQAEVAVPGVEPLPARPADPADTLVVDPWSRIDDDAPGPVARVAPAARPFGRRALLFGAVAALLLAAGGVGGYQLIVKSKEGTLTVEVDGDADLRFQSGKLQLYDADGTLRYTIAASEKNATLAPGKYLVKITDANGLKVESEEFTLDKGGKATVRVRAEPPEAVAKADPPAAGPAVALDFNGVDARVDIPTLHPPAAGPVTIEVWARAELKGKGTMLEVVGDGRVLKLHHENRLWMGDAWKADRSALDFRVSPARAGRWTHLAVCWDGRAQTFFVDGAKVPGESKLFPLPHQPHAQPARIGCATVGIDAFAEFFRGSVAEVRVSGAIRYADTFTPQARFAPDADTVALYHCDEGAGDTLADSSGNGHHGKIVGAGWVTADAAAPGPDAERAVVDWVLKLGGNVGVTSLAGYFDTGRGDKIPPGPVTVKGVNVGEKKGVADDDLRLLAGLRGLDTLVISRTAVTDRGIATLAALPKLDALYASGLPLTDAGIEPLRKFSLVKLHLSETKVTDAALPRIAGFDRLDDLHLDRCAITDVGLEALAKLHALRRLVVTRTRVTEAGVKKLAAALPKCRIEWDGGALGPPAK